MRPRKTHAEHLDVSLVRRLLASQFPEWADLPIRPVEHDGWDNTTFRLGEDMSVRLPSRAFYAPQVEKEQKWLPKLAPLLPLQIPVPVAMGVPSPEFPFPWSVYAWIEGEIATFARIDDLPEFASDLAAFLVALQRIDPTGGPPPGIHSFGRGGPLAEYAAPYGSPGNWGTMDAISALKDRIDAEAATQVWEAALEAKPQDAPVWVHGDVASTNLLVRGDRVSAVIDFGCSAVGDPACDLVIAWTFFSGESRDAFRAAVSLDDATWRRGRGWALWKALVVLARGASDLSQDPQRVIDEVIAEHYSVT